jgi:subtilisin family serine protease
MAPLDLVRLTPLMQRSGGRPEIVVGLVDGPVALDHPDLTGERIQHVKGGANGCLRTDSWACAHGTFVAGILAARRGSPAPAICPDCTLVVRPIFTEDSADNQLVPSATPEELMTAIVETIDFGARILNLSAAVLRASGRDERAIEDVLNYAARRGVIVVAAAGNQGALASSAITRHPWVIPVAACDCQGRPILESNLGTSIGRRGLVAPGDEVTSLGSQGEPKTLRGTSAATPFVSGTIALVWSEFPAASAAEVKTAITRGEARPRNRLLPPLLDAWTAFQATASFRQGR